MVAYKNPKIPEATQGKPKTSALVGEGAKLSIYLVILVAVIGGLFYYAGALIGGVVPFEWEEKLAMAEVFPLVEPHPPAAKAKEKALQKLADRLAAEMDLDPEISITIHYRDLETVNAFAGFGGHIYVFEGLLQRLDYEEQVAALLAHEIGHVKNRHIMKSFSANVFLTLAFEVITGDTVAGDSLGQAVLTLESFTFTRNMEKEADEEALEALKKLYRNVGGFVALFEAFEGGAELKAGNYEFLLTHPYSKSRVERAEEFSIKEETSLSDPDLKWQVKSPGENQ